MSQITITTDVWKPATSAEKLQALASFGRLAVRDSDAVEIDTASYMIAMDGCTRYGLSQAVIRILQGKLGHAFFPSPPELRLQHDEAMRHHREMRQRIERRQKLDNEYWANKPKSEGRSEAEKVRQAERMRRFHAEIDDANSAEAEEALRADVRARYGMTEECLASIPSQEEGANWRKAKFG